MNRRAKRSFFKIIHVVGLLLITFFTVAQKSKGPVTLPRTYTYSFHSRLNGGDYELLISLPTGYKSNDTIRYPIVYMLDGNIFLPMFMSMQQFFILGEESIPMIIVGIGYPVSDLMASMPLRTRDYTPTADRSFDSMLTAESHLPVSSGGASLFLKTLSNEIIPFVEGKYKTSGDRTIAGHSFGALFASYTLFHQPTLFTRYLLSSVSLPWDNASLLKDEVTFLQTVPQNFRAKIFISVGSLETFNMIPLMKQMTMNLKNRKFEGVTIEEHVFDNESHTSVVATAFNQGIRALFKNEQKK